MTNLTNRLFLMAK